MTEQVSPDGFYRWDPSQWLPTGKAPVAAGIATVSPGNGAAAESLHGPDVPTSKKKMAVEAFGLKKHFGKQAEGPLGMD
jgi:hypothetical protein